MQLNMKIFGVNQGSSIVRHMIKANVLSRVSNFKSTLNMLVIDNITSKLPSISLPPNAFDIPANIKLADPNFYESSYIDILIKQSTGMVLQKTQLGWIVSGKQQVINVSSQSSCHLQVGEIDSTLKKFWVLEEIPEMKMKKCTKIILKSQSTLGDSKEQALRRFYELERKLERQPTLKRQYCEFMDEYLSLGHMTAVADNIEGEHFYLPHHTVIRESSLTTKLHVVFDASAESSSGISLNDKLLVGPTIQQDLFSIICRFRMHKFVLTADVAKMYRQILVDNSYVNYQRIFWRCDPKQRLQRYALRTVTYGSTSAPFLATRCLAELANEAMDKYPKGTRIILKDFYADDLLTGANTKEEALQIRDEVNDILAGGCFELRKWATNDHSLLNC